MRCGARAISAGDGDIIDDLARPQRCERVAGPGIEIKFRQLFDVDIERIEKQPAVGRIRAAIAGTIVEQRVQRIEADAVSAKMRGEFDHAFEIGEIADAPIARERTP